MKFGHQLHLTVVRVVAFIVVELLLGALLLVVFEEELAASDDVLTPLFLVALPASVLAAGSVAWVIATRVEKPIAQLAELARDLEPGTASAVLDVDDATGAVEQLQADLNDALARLDEGYAAQAQFVANVAHELKTPIAVMLADTQVLLSQERRNEEYTEYAAGMEKEMRRLGRLVESFLIVTRAERKHGLTQRVVVPLSDVLLESVEHCGGYAQLFGARIVPRIELEDDDEPPEIVGDPELLRTMLDNLVRNAVRFSPADAAVEVTLARVADVATLTVRDHGPGVPADELDSIFERFEQAQSSHPRSQGTGLGLSIAASVARLHDGQISVRNCDAGGCEFTVTLPLGDSAA